MRQGMIGSRSLGAALVAGVLAVGLPAGPAQAVFSGDMSPRAESGDKAYAAAIRARDAKLWGVMVGHLEKVVAARPWHDNAHSLLGFGYRKLGDFDKSLVHYHKALELNPRHRQALEYLGEAYLQMGDVEKARETMVRLGEVCSGISLTFSDGDFSDGCEEYKELRRVFAHYEEHGELPPEETRAEW
ncbi:MAG: tetratricopeptide repeat protein [Pseudomonadota bacterium]